MQEVEAECRRVPLNEGDLASMKLQHCSRLNPTQHCIITYCVPVSLCKIHTRNTELHYFIVPERINTRAYVKVSTHVIIMAKANTNYMENADIQY